MSLPKEPRQLMINLMYLVLTAMLALNVSSEILHAFEVINNSITSSNSSIEQKNEEIYDIFQEKLNDPVEKDRIRKYHEKAQIVKAKSASMIAKLEEWKERVIAQAGGRDDDGEIKKKDDIDASTLLLVERRGGDTLRNELEQLRNDLLNVVSEQNRNSTAKDLPLQMLEVEKTENNKQGDWAYAYFHYMPTMAVVTLMTKFQNDVRNSEALILNQLAEESLSDIIKFDAIEAIAVPTTSYALEGQTIEAKILMAAYNKTLEPKITITGGGGSIKEVAGGVGQYETKASGIGLKTVKGKVVVDMGGGRTIEDEFDFQYMVGSTGASMQLDKMNVFYIGVPNPITVSAAGYSLQDVSVSIDGATIEKGEELGQYIVNVSKQGEVDANIMAKSEGSVKKVGGMKVRVKFIPDPVAEIGGKSQGAMPTNIFQAQRGVIAALKGFDFDARFVVTSYRFSLLPKRGELLGPYDVEGPYLDRDKNVSNLIKRAKPGDRVFVEEIRAIGPDKRSRALNSITLLLL